MVPVDIVGKTGRALTEIGNDGRVEINDRTYAAATSRPSIPTGSPVQVTGWRLVGESTYVLSVRLPGDDAPEPGAATERPAQTDPAVRLFPVTLPQEDPYDKRLRNLERRVLEHERYQHAARGAIAWGAGISLILGLLFSYATHKGPEVGIAPFALLRWAASGAVVGAIIHLVRGPRGETS